MIGSLAALCLFPVGQPAYEPTDRYTVQQIEGFTVYVHQSLLNEEGDLGTQVLKLLGAKLYDVTRTVPPAALAELRQVPIWMELAHEPVPGGCYHPSPEWLVEHDFNPEKARSIEFGNARNFLGWSLDQPSMVMHELAHAYHHRVIGYDNAEIKAAYDHAVQGGTYESVLYCHGEMQRAYALNSDQEYFAELSEAFFGVNDFYPFVRAEVQEHDPTGYAMLQRIWDL